MEKWSVSAEDWMMLGMVIIMGWNSFDIFELNPS